jgi:hypothetical protein
VRTPGFPQNGSGIGWEREAKERAVTYKKELLKTNPDQFDEN